MNECESNGTTGFFSRPFVRLFEGWAAVTPDAVALRFRGQVWTYRELDARAESIAAALPNGTDSQQKLIGLSVARTPDLVAAIIGVHKAGAAYVPLDPKYPFARLATIVRESKVDTILVDSLANATLGRLEVERIELRGIDKVVRHRPRRHVGSDQLSHVIYTSGSTGVPKGVAIEHRNVAALLAWASDVYTSAELSGVLFATSMSFDLSVFEVMLPLSVGGAVIIAENALALAELEDRRHVRLLNTVPSAAAELLRMGGIPDTLRTINLAGEVLRKELVDALYTRTHVGRIFNLYGPTEDTTYSTWAVIPREGQDEPTIGRPIAHTEAFVLDAELRETAAGVPGELFLAGAGVARGYLHRPDLTAQRFIEIRLGGCVRRVYRTGDRASVGTDGQLRFHGRLDFQVKLRGFRIELGEVEAVLAAYPQVAETVVVMRRVQGRDQLVAYVVGEALDVAQLRAWAGQQLPDYMVPTTWIELERLPRTISGKVDRDALPLEVQTRPINHPPQTAQEVALAKIWCEVLELPAVDTEDSFLALGGDSILALRVVAHAAEAGLRMTLRGLFEAESLGQLARQIKPLTPAEESSATQVLNRSVARLLAVEYGANVEDAYPLTPMQEGLLVASRLDTSVYHVQITLDMHGPLDEGELREAWRVLQRRHAVLRTVLWTPPGAAPQQVVLWEIPLDIRIVENAGGESGERLVAIDCDDGLPAGGPFLRCRVMGGQPRWRMVLFFHHLILDGWSVNALIGEWVEVYAARLHGRDPQLRERRSFGEYARWMQLQVSQQVVDVAYWERYLRGLCAPTMFPRVGEPDAATMVSVVERTLPDPLQQALEDLYRRSKMTANTVFCAAWAILLSRYISADDVLFGVSTCGRNIEFTGSESVLGLLMITLPLRVQLGVTDSLRELLRAVQMDVLSGQEHGQVPLAAMKRASEVPADQPLFESLVVIANYPASDVGRADGVQIVGRSSWERTHFPLTLIVEPGALATLQLHYRRDIFDDRAAERLYKQLEQVLRAMCEAHLDSPHQSLSIVGEAEQRLLLRAWAGPERTVARECLKQRFEAQVSRTPELVAVRCGEDLLTYRELATRARQLARYLRKLGVGRGTPVAIYLERSTRMLVGLLGVIEAGAAYVPVDPEHPPQRTALMLADSGASVVVTEAKLRSGLPTGVPTVCFDRDGTELAALSSEEIADASTWDDLAYLIYTSGSTGTPKGVEITHGALAHLLAIIGSEIPLTPGDKVLAVTSLSFDIHGVELFLPLVSGATVEIAPRCVVLDSLALRERLESGVTFMQATPATWTMLLAAGWGGTSGLRALCCGEPLPLELAQELAARSRQAWNLYGPTEATIYATKWAIDPKAPRVAIGRGLANTPVYVLDRHGKLAGVGVAGELYIGGPQVARGYLNRPQLTEERFVPDPFVGDPCARMYRTGDRVRWGEDGQLYFLGRFDHQVKLRGYRIELGEIESVLERKPEVEQAVVMVVGKGEGKQLIAWVSTHRPELLSEGSLRAFLNESLPDYMVPTRFVVLSEFPVTASGKVDRRRLPPPEALKAQSEKAPPVGDLEHKLCSLWAEVLGVDVTSTRHTFFDLGGNSLQLARVGILVHEKLNYTLSIMELLRLPTVERLAAYIRGRGSCVRSRTRGPSRTATFPGLGAITGVAKRRRRR